MMTLYIPIFTNPGSSVRRLHQYFLAGTSKYLDNNQLHLKSQTTIIILMRSLF